MIARAWGSAMAGISYRCPQIGSIGRNGAHASLSDHYFGGLGELGREAFANFKIEYADGNTVLTGDLDQAALYSALNRILALGLELVALSRLSEAPV